MENLSGGNKPTVHEELLSEVVEELLKLCSENPLNVVKIAKLSGLSRPTIQRLFDRQSISLASLYKLRRWINSYDRLD